MRAARVTSADHSAVSTEPMIRLDAISKQYPNGQVAVRELTLDIPVGEICVLVGPSGCGKTTTLKMVNRLIEPTAGRIFLDGADVTHADPVELRRRIGYVIQQVGLFPHQTIATNIATVPKLLGWSKDRITARTDELLDLVGLDPAEYRERYPAQLSGGQRQRVGVARALAADPPVLLMDEPFGAIDPVTRVRLQDEFLRLQGEVQKTVVFVTHDIEEAVKMGDRIAILDVGGVLEQYATPGRDPRAAGVADGARLRRCRPRAEAAAGHAHRGGVPRAPADGRTRRHAGRRPRRDREVGRRLGRRRRRRRRAARLRRRRRTPRATARSPTRLQRIETWVPLDQRSPGRARDDAAHARRAGCRCSTATASSAC